MEVERLREIFIESRAQPEFAFLLAGGQRNRFLPWLTLFRFRHQFEPTPVREPNIAEQDFETQVGEQGQRILHVRRGRDFIAAVGQETGKDFAAVLMILNQ